MGHFTAHWVAVFPVVGVVAARRSPLLLPTGRRCRRRRCPLVALVAAHCNCPTKEMRSGQDKTGLIISSVPLVGWATRTLHLPCAFHCLRGVKTLRLPCGPQLGGGGGGAKKKKTKAKGELAPGQQRLELSMPAAKPTPVPEAQQAQPAPPPPPSAFAFGNKFGGFERLQQQPSSCPAAAAAAAAPPPPNAAAASAAATAAARAAVVAAPAVVAVPAAAAGEDAVRQLV